MALPVRGTFVFEQNNILMPYPTANLGFTGHIYKSIDTTTTLMTLPLALAPRGLTIGRADSGVLGVLLVVLSHCWQGLLEVILHSIYGHTSTTSSK